MCGRFYVREDDHDEEIAALIAQMQQSAPESGAKLSGDIFPSDAAAVIAVNRRLEPRAFAMRWGFQPGGGKRLIINARCETAAEKPMFRESARLRRCLIPASGYYEWEHRGAEKLKYAISPTRPCYLAGLYSVGEGEMPRFTVLTRDAARSIAFIHDRMPVLLPKSMAADWLNRDADFGELINSAVEDVTYQAEDAACRKTPLRSSGPSN